MELILVGLSHRTCTVETREALAVGPGRRRLLLEYLASGKLPAAELVWVSTCNRVDIYAVGRKKDCEAALIGFLSNPAAFDSGGSSGGHLYSKSGREAMEHLLNAACGLDSLVVGENEILGQIKEAYADARRAGTTGRLTNILFQRALALGKQVRAETFISRGGRSVAYVAVQYAGRVFGELENARVLLLGAGEMAEEAAEAFAEKKASLTVVNRTLAKGQELAGKFGAACRPWEELRQALAAADVALVSTSAPEPVITRELMKETMALRHGEPVFLVDISVPRNVQAEAGGLANVYLYNIDDLERIVADNLAQLEGEIKKAELIMKNKADETWEKFSQEAAPKPEEFPAPLLIGTRGSRLALAQTETIRAGLAAAGVPAGIKVIKTAGDLTLDQPVEKLIATDGKGLFVKEIEKELLDGGVRLAMHSLKDLPGDLAPGLALAACLERDDPRDVLVTRDGKKLAELPPNPRIGTGSSRRRYQLAKLRPDAVFGPMRGNIDTRLAKLDRGDCDALVLAYAALTRLGLEKRAAQIFTADEVVPAPGQGVVAVEAREADAQALRAARLLDHGRTRLCAECERQFLAELGGGCATPLGAFAELTAEGVLFRIFWASADGSKKMDYRAVIDCSRAREQVSELAAKIRGML
jgi:glutamyl-tRNA reductase/hydroxymethylbilane synthase